jgi:hypothetical protein
MLYGWVGNFYFSTVAGENDAALLHIRVTRKP